MSGDNSGVAAGSTWPGGGGYGSNGSGVILDRAAAQIYTDEAPAEVVMPLVAQFDALVHEWADLSMLLGNLCRQLEPIVGEDALGVAADPAETTGPDMHGTSHLIRRLHSLATDIRSSRRDLQHFINRIEV